MAHQDFDFVRHCNFDLMSAWTVASKFTSQPDAGRLACANNELTGLGGIPGLACISGLNGGRCIAAGIPGFGPHWPGCWPGGC